MISASPSVAGAQERNHPMVTFFSVSRYPKNFTMVKPKLIIDSEVRTHAIGVRSAARKVRFVASRVRGEHGASFGTLGPGVGPTAVDLLLERALSG